MSTLDWQRSGLNYIGMVDNLTLFHLSRVGEGYALKCVIPGFISRRVDDLEMATLVALDSLVLLSRKFHNVGLLASSKKSKLYIDPDTPHLIPLSGTQGFCVRPGQRSLKESPIGWIPLKGMDWEDAVGYCAGKEFRKGKVRNGAKLSGKYYTTRQIQILAQALLECRIDVLHNKFTILKHTSERISTRSINQLINLDHIQKTEDDRIVITEVGLTILKEFIDARR